MSPLDQATLNLERALYEHYGVNHGPEVHWGDLTETVCRPRHIVRLILARNALLAAPDAETVRLADGEALQTLIPGVAAIRPAVREIAALEARRAARRGWEPLPSGSLFDEVAARQQDLFS
jgi:hypothetical protein